MGHTLDNVVSFLGYGRPSAPVWFIGLEEGLGASTTADAKKNLEERAKFDNIMDLREAHHNRLWSEGSRINWGERSPKTQVWLYMAKIMRAYNQQSDCCSNTVAAKDYVSRRLGRSSPDGETFLTELSPIPSKSKKDEYWMSYFRDKVPDLERKLRARKKALQSLIKENSQSLIVCYGAKPEDFAELLGNVHWELVRPKVYRARGHRHLLLPFFGNGQISHHLIMGLLDSELLAKG